MSRVRRRWGAAAALLVAACVGGGMPAEPASADPQPPVATYQVLSGLDSGRLFAGALDGSGIPTLLSPGAYVDWYDVSQDGDVVVAAISTGPTGVHGWDMSWGVVRVSRSEGTTHLLATNYDSPLWLSADGRKACWISDRFIVCSTDGGRALSLPSGIFQPRLGEQVLAFAMSPDGANAAALYQRSDLRILRLGAATVQPDVYRSEVWSTSSAEYAGTWSFTWIDNTHLLYSVGNADGQTGSVTYSTDGATAVSSLGAARSLSEQAGTWWMWRRDGTALSFGSTPDVATPPASWTPSLTPAGQYYAYDVAATIPPVMTAADNRARTTPSLVVRESTVAWRHRATYCARADYLVANDLPVEFVYVNMRGKLQYSYSVGASWSDLVTTTGAHAVQVNAPCGYNTGTTHLLTRNTWFRWVYPGDAITEPSLSRTVLVHVVPVVSAKVVRYGSSRLVYGAATRTYGTAWLQRYSGRRWVTVVSVRIGRTGTYSFGKRRLATGSYRVVTVKDAYWNAGVTKAFRI